MSGGRRTGALLLVVLLLVHVPLVHSTWLRWRVERSGVDVVAQLVDRSGEGGRYSVGFELPAAVDGSPLGEDERRWSAEVSETAYDAAVAAGSIGVRVLADRPSAYEVDGQVRGPGVWLLPLGLDALVLLGLVLWRVGRSRQPGADDPGL